MREPARTPAAAQARFLRFLQASLSCVTKTIWYVAPSVRRRQHLVAITAEDPVRLRRRSEKALFLSAVIDFHFTEDARYEGEWKVKTDAYSYSLAATEELAEEIILWHWHPESRPSPHIHVPASDLHKRHIPSGRVSFEEVLRFLIEEFGVAAQRDDWGKVLGESEKRFRTFRAWS